MKKVFVATQLCALVILGLGCGKKKEAMAPETEQGSGEMHEFIVLTDAQYARSDIETGTFGRRTMEEYLPATAEIYLGTEHTGAVSTITEGIITELRVGINSPVRKGDVVAVLHKPGLLDLQQDFLGLKDRMGFLKAEYERYKSLSAENATATKNFQKAEVDLREAQTALALTGAKLRQYQIDPEKLSPTQLQTQVQLRAPVSGRVTRIHTGLGAALGNGAAVCEIADFSKVQAVIYIFEKDILRIRPGSKVLLYFASDPRRTFPATIVSLDGAIDKARKSLRAYAKFDQPVSGLPAGAYMEAKIAPVAGIETSVLPVEAVVQENDGKFIFILEGKTGENFKFHKVAVQIGASDSGFIAVSPLEPLAPDAKIVVKGAYYVSAQGSGIEVEE